MSPPRKPEPLGPRAAWLSGLLASDPRLFTVHGVLRRDVWDPIDRRWHLASEDAGKAWPEVTTASYGLSGAMRARRRSRRASGAS